jgi:hypothetical protein
MSVTGVKITRKTVKDPQFRTAAVIFDGPDVTKYVLEGTPSKLSTAWVAACENDTTRRQAIERTAEVLHNMDLISDEGYRAFLYRIGKRDQIEPYDFEDAGWLAGQMLPWLENYPDGVGGVADALYTRMIDAVGHQQASSLWRAAAAAAHRLHASA